MVLLITLYVKEIIENKTVYFEEVPCKYVIVVRYGKRTPHEPSCSDGCR